MVNNNNKETDNKDDENEQNTSEKTVAYDMSPISNDNNQETEQEQVSES